MAWPNSEKVMWIPEITINSLSAANIVWPFSKRDNYETDKLSRAISFNFKSRAILNSRYNSPNCIDFSSFIQSPLCQMFNHHQISSDYFYASNWPITMPVFTLWIHISHNLSHCYNITPLFIVTYFFKIHLKIPLIRCSKKQLPLLNYQELLKEK